MRRLALSAALLAFGFVAAGPAGAAAVEPLPFDRILRHAEMTRLLQAWAAARPELLQLESLGRTPQGREMWFLTLTRRDTGPASDKPALLVDGNMHANEWAGGVAALHFVHTLLTGYGRDARVTRLLDTRTVYVLPRMTPDGVDATLDQGRYIRSVDRPYPPNEPQTGILPGDLDGDGRSVFMRFRDPNGPWKADDRDPRLMVPREPDETGGEYWRVLQEGTIAGYDGVTIGNEPEHESLDFGANFPGDRGNSVSQTDGPYPTSVPEVAAYVAAIASRPNIVAHVTCHTFGGLVLTPPVNLGEQMPDADRLVYRTLAGKAAAATGYTAISYLDLRSVDRERHIPSAFGWLYDRLGLYSFITEFWNPLKAAGISLENTTASAWLWGFHAVDDERKLLRWSDEALDGDGFVAWRPFEHPQLGRVEIGGFDLIRYWYNPPFDRLEQEVAPHSAWLVQLGLSTALLAVRSFEAAPLGGNLWRLRLVVENAGWLPTNGSQQALDQKAVGPVTASLELPADARRVEGAADAGLGQLAGRSDQRSTASWWGYTPGTPDRAFAEWIISAPAGSRVGATARHERAGVARAEVVLDAAVSQPRSDP